LPSLGVWYAFKRDRRFTGLLYSFARKFDKNRGLIYIGFYPVPVKPVKKKSIAKK
jgi:hypothetical protein